MSARFSLVARSKYTVEEWQAEAAQRFGPAEEGNWSFVCPACGHIQSPASIKASGHGDPNLAYSECFGRATRPDLGTDEKPGDCDWKAWGLFCGPVRIERPAGPSSFAFDFADAQAELPPGFVMPTPRKETVS